MRESLLILGASVRAAAQSAARAGLRPYCGDLFCDADLPNTAVGQVARSFPGDLVAIAEQAPPGPWMYTGGLENYPRLVARVSRRHELLGTGPEALRQVRNPFELERVLSAAGLLFPECRSADERIAMHGGWLLKHRRSSGGLRVLPANAPSEVRGRGWYYQQRVDGLAMGAVYVASCGAGVPPARNKQAGRLHHKVPQGQAIVLGVTEQLLTGSGNRPFRYAGSVGPVELSPSQRQTVNEIGRVLAANFALRGLFGADLIFDGDRIWTIEVNPRYTASVEILERAFRFSAVALHLAACRGPPLGPIESRASRQYGKSVLYADRPWIMTAERVQALKEINRAGIWPTLADIPHAGTQVKIGQPVLTVFAEGNDRASVQAQLCAQTKRIGLCETLRAWPKTQNKMCCTDGDAVP
ncbi:MAG: ATP-grasp domain-containing protein [Pirellulales bacterium]